MLAKIWKKIGIIILIIACIWNIVIKLSNVIPFRETLEMIKAWL